MKRRHHTLLWGALAVLIAAGACADKGQSTPSTVNRSLAEVESITPAVGIEREAGAEFDEAGLTGQGRSSFVPLNDPEMVAADGATWLDPDSIVMGATADDGTAHAYPIEQMAYHHIANTTLAGEPFLVTY